MTREDARIAVRLNAVVQSESSGIKGYAYQLVWTHEKGSQSYEAIGIHDLRANAVYLEKTEKVNVVDWQAPDRVINEMRERMKRKL